MTEAELLFTSLLKCDRAALYLWRDTVLDGAIAARVADALRRRAQGEPLQYITGEAEFMGLTFAVTPDCLIPRPETELLVETVVRYAGAADLLRQLNVLDAGTGSGCIAVSMAKLLQDCSVVAADIVEATLNTARQNVRKHGVQDKVVVVRADLFAGVPRSGARRLRPESGGRFDIIVSNPPYIARRDMGKLQREVRCEPRIALDGGDDGCDAYRGIAALAPALLSSNGLLFLELGYGSAHTVRNIFHNSGKFEIIEVINDYNGIERVMVLKKNTRRSAR